MAPAGLSGLPVHVLDDIARRVGPLDNYSCPFVCRPWGAALNAARLSLLQLPNKPHHLHVEPRCNCRRSPSPWTIDTCDSPGEEPWTKKVYLQRGSGPVGVVMDGKKKSAHPTRVIGCNYGWAVTVDNARSLTLLDPLTGRQFPLPPITASLGRITQVTKNLKPMGRGMFHKAALAPGRRLGTFAVMLIHSGGQGLSFLAPGARCWTAMRAPPWKPKRYLDVASHKGAFYTLSVDSELNAWMPDGSSTGLRPRRVASPQTEPEWAVLAESTTRDELLMVSTPDTYGGRPYFGMTTKVSCYDEREGGWIPAVNKGDTAILLRGNSGLCVPWLYKPRGRPTPTPENLQVSYWDDDLPPSNMPDDCSFLRHGCWFLPYVAPEFPRAEPQTTTDTEPKSSKISRQRKRGGGARP